MNPLKELNHGQSVWLDFISRQLIRSGEQAAGGRGRSARDYKQPNNFGAIGGSSDYDDTLDGKCWRGS